MVKNEEKEIRDLLKKKIADLTREYLKQISKYKKALEVLGETYKDNESLISNSLQHIEASDTAKRILKHFSGDQLSLKYKINVVLEEADKPLTSREIMQEINKRFKDKEFSFRSFSGHFSATWKKAHLIKFDFPNKPLNERVVYALPKWVDNRKLQDKYLNKLYGIEY